MPTRRTALLLPLALAACATEVVPPTKADEGLRVGIQDPGLHPRNGGMLVEPEALKPGDIVLSSAPSLQSLGIRALTLSPVSHASLALGGGRVAEAVGEGIRMRTLKEVVEEESIVVAFRHPALAGEHVERMSAFVQENLGRKYNVMGVVLQAPFSVERRMCELPLVPGALRDFCVRGVGAVQLAAGPTDRFFCSQFVLEAYRRAGLPLTDADPRLLNPADLLHMREGDVPSVRSHQALQYVGHLKWEAANATSPADVAALSSRGAS